MTTVIIITADADRFTKIAFKLEPLTRKWPVLKDAVFIRADIGSVFVWLNDGPVFVNREAIAIIGVTDPHNNFANFQAMKRLIAADFKEATGLDTAV